MIAHFNTVKVEQIERNLNNHADALATLTSALSADLKLHILVDILISSSITLQACRIHSITIDPSWMDPFILFLKDGILLEQRKEAKGIKRKASRFWLSKNLKLYIRSFSRPYLLCVHPDIVQDLLYEIHEGICGSQTGGRSLAHRALTKDISGPTCRRTQ
jgi:hypothetical protein